MTVELSIYADWITDAWNSHDIERVLGFYFADYVGSDVGQAGPVMGHKDLRTVLESFWRAFPDLRFDVTHTLAQGCRVAIIWQAQGTHRGTFMKIPPTGREVVVSGVSIIEVQEGLVVRGQYIWDLAGMLRKMGLLPEL